MQDDTKKAPSKYHKIIHCLVHTMHAHHRIIEKQVSDVGLHRSQRMLLLNLARDGRTLSQRELADKLGVTPAAVARTLKQLSQEGYILREFDQADSRRNAVIITEKGLNIVQETRRTFEAFDEKTFKGFSDSELDTLLSLLERINSNLIEIDGDSADADKRK